mmetsp:Transcript_38107/g.60287  ORF Transcript_38107/g.60287 Transcript_38107/m.60287 type:complete len:232 (+) Transcript_38107:265-960(+)
MLLSSLLVSTDKELFLSFPTSLASVLSLVVSPPVPSPIRSKGSLWSPGFWLSLMLMLMDKPLLRLPTSISPPLPSLTLTNPSRMSMLSSPVATRASTPLVCCTGCSAVRSSVSVVPSPVRSPGTLWSISSSSVTLMPSKNKKPKLRLLPPPPLTGENSPKPRTGETPPLRRVVPLLKDNKSMLLNPLLDNNGIMDCPTLLLPGSKNKLNTYIKKHKNRVKIKKETLIKIFL